MYIKVALFLLFEICTFANSLDLHTLKIFEDTKNIYTIETLMKNKDLFKKAEKTNLGIKKHIVWTYQKIKNTTDIEQKRILTNPRAGIDFVDVFIISDNKIVKTALLGDMRPQIIREFVHRKSSFLFTMSPNKEYEIYVKYKSFGALDIDWELNSPLNMYLSSQMSL